jgi:MFS family permease
MSIEDSQKDHNPFAQGRKAQQAEEFAESDPGEIPLLGEEQSASRDNYGALRYPNFLLLLSSVFLTMFGQQMLTVAIGWELYNRTNSALVLGGIGLAQVIPLLVLFLPAGYAADNINRKYVLAVAQTVSFLATLGLAALSFQHGPLLLIYGCLVLLGSSQSFTAPTNSALVSQVIPEQEFEKAMTWRSSVTQLSAVLGPTAGGFLIGILGGASLVYIGSGLCFLTVVILVLIMRVGPQKGPVAAGRKLSSLIDGVRFLSKTQVMLAAITLDLFAVLLGGAVTLLPIFARDILHVGPFGLGWLQAASSLGAVGMALFLAQRPAFKRAGPILLLAVAGFGAATIIFGLSHWFWLSFLMLLVLGALDNISVVIRSTLVLVRTPDEMRGRVSAVNSLFIGTSNQLGGFESGLTAQILGPIGSVVLGGIGTVLVVALVASFWPEMRRLRTLREQPSQ